MPVEVQRSKLVCDILRIGQEKKSQKSRKLTFDIKFRRKKSKSKKFFTRQETCLDRFGMTRNVYITRNIFDSRGVDFVVSRVPRPFSYFRLWSYLEPWYAVRLRSTPPRRRQHHEPTPYHAECGRSEQQLDSGVNRL